jgi:hypothetical protein
MRSSTYVEELGLTRAAFCLRATLTASCADQCRAVQPLRMKVTFSVTRYSRILPFEITTF